MEKLTIYLKKNNKIIINNKDIINIINKTKYEHTKQIIKNEYSIFFINIKPKQENLKKYKSLMIVESNNFKQITLFIK